jgi:Ca-activated chloride channel family protein
MPVSFVWPAMLASLLLLIPLGVLYLRVQRRRRELAARNPGFGPRPLAAGGGPGWRRKVPPALFLAAFALLCVAAARPRATLALPRFEGTVMLVVDVSGSMAATDLQPTRMAVAKAAAEELVRLQPPTARLGVVAFSDGGLTVQQPTGDGEAALAVIQRLEPQRGTAVGEGLLAALRTLAAEAGQQPVLEPPAQGEPAPPPAAPVQIPPATIVLLSDGENNAQPEPLEVAQAAAGLGVRIYTIGVGTTAGAQLQLDGFSVHSRLEEEPLRQLAALTGGAYLSAQDQPALRGIYDTMAAQFVVREEPAEITALFAGAGLLLLLVGGLCSFLWFNRLA